MKYFFKTVTLAFALGEPRSISPLLIKFKRLGYPSPEHLAALAITRGCHHYAPLAKPNPDFAPPSATFISNEELAIALLSPAHPYDPTLIRIGSQLLSGTNSNPEKLARLAKMERCESILGYIADCGKKTEPENPFWDRVLTGLCKRKAPPSGVLPHLSRFRIEYGIQDRRKAGTPKIHWLRPAIK